MTFVISKLLWAVLCPSGLLVLLAGCGLLLGWRGRPRWSRALLLAGIGGLLAVLLLPLDRWALRPLEDRFARPALPAHIDGIIVIGGAIETALSEDRGIPSLNGAAERITEFVALSRQYPAAKLAFSGGNGLLDGGVPEAVPALLLFERLGVAPERIAFEAASRTTWENARFSHDMLHPGPGETWLLITSASHMPRAMGAFRHAGWRVLPWPVGYKTLEHGGGVPPNGEFGVRLASLDWAVHEWIGLVAYRIMGRTDSLFPADCPDTPPAATRVDSAYAALQNGSTAEESR